MKDIGWKLFYLPARIFVVVGIIVACVMWLPLIVWFLIDDVVVQEGEVFG